MSGSVTIDTITPKTPKKKTEFEVISGDSEKGKEISEKLGITARPGYPVTESGKADLKLVKALTADEKFRAELKTKLMELPEFKKTNMTEADMDFVLKDVRADLGMDGSYATVMKNSKLLDEQKKKTTMDEAWNEATEGMPTSGSIDDLKKWLKEKETKTKVKKKDRLATAKELEEYESILDPTGDAYIVQEGMTVGELDKMVADHKAYVNDMYQKYKRGELNKYVKKDRINIRLMKNYDKELDAIELAKEGYTLQEIDIITRARKVMKTENQNPDDALAWVRGEMADEAGVEFEEFMTDFDWGDFPGKDDLAAGGRVGLGAGSKRTRHAKDYESYARPSDYWKQSTNYPWYPKGYNKDIDDFRTMQKERFMYGERRSPSNFEQIWKDVQKLFNKKRNTKEDGGRVRYANGSNNPGELTDLLVRLRNVVEGSGMYSSFSHNRIERVYKLL